jgi:hypothetical protein
MTLSFRVACLLVALSLASAAVGQAPPAPPTPTPTADGGAPIATPAPTATETPKPIPELAKLQFLVGDWVHDEIDHTAASAGGTRRAARSRIGWILGGQRLYFTYKSAGPSGDYEGRGLLGWDTEAKAHRLDWFDSRGAAQRYDGRFDPEDTLVFSAEFKADGERQRQQLTIKKQPGGKFLFIDSIAAGDRPMKTTLESLAQPAPQPTPTPTPAATMTPVPGAATTMPAPTPTASPSAVPKTKR